MLVDEENQIYFNKSDSIIVLSFFYFIGYRELNVCIENSNCIDDPAFQK